jgi:hypothetical protein
MLTEEQIYTTFQPSETGIGSMVRVWFEFESSHMKEFQQLFNRVLEDENFEVIITPVSLSLRRIQISKELPEIDPNTISPATKSDCIYQVYRYIQPFFYGRKNNKTIQI